MDNLTRIQRYKNMQNIKSKDTKIEITLRKELWKRKIRYRKNVKGLPGKPDIAIKKYKLAIFCDSEFWHGKDWEHTHCKIKSNTDYWYQKIENNIKRDQKVNELLRNLGWTVLRFWGNDIMNDTVICVEKILNRIKISSKE